MKTIRHFSRALLTLVLLAGIVAGGFWATRPARAAKLDPLGTLVRVSTGTPEERRLAERLGPIVEDYGAFVVVTVTADSARRTQTLRMAEKAGMEVAAVETSIGLHRFRFDPLREDPAARFAATGGYARMATTEADYFLVQFAVPAKRAWLDDLRNAGGEVIQYVPNQAFLVYGAPDAMRRIAAHPRVRWTGPYQPVYKLSTDLMWCFGERLTGLDARRRQDANYGETGEAVYQVAVYKRADHDQVRARLEDLGDVTAEETPSSVPFDLMQVRVKPENLRAVAMMKDVMAVDTPLVAEAEDEVSAHITAGNIISATQVAAPGYNPARQFGVDGTGVTVAIVDSGIMTTDVTPAYLSANNVADGPYRGAEPPYTGSHGQGVATMVLGSQPLPSTARNEAGYIYGLGVAPGAHAVNIPKLARGRDTTATQEVDDIVTTPGPNGVRPSLSNNSWGGATNDNEYDTQEALYDSFVIDASRAASVDPLLFVFSAGNRGPAEASLTRPKAAKNPVVVAASESIRSDLDPRNARSVENIGSFSSRGPAADGRIKPDISAPGSAITFPFALDTATANSPRAIDEVHAFGLGTSYASPHIAGAAALFTQYWRSLTDGRTPSPALVKAALINTAFRMTGERSLGAIPNGNQGWGRINLRRMFTTVIPIQYFDQGTLFTETGQVFTLSPRFEVADPTQPVRVTLVYTDPPGAAGANPALVNDLDLEVLIGDDLFRGNRLQNSFSIPGGSADRLNPVENVFLPPGLDAGTPIVVRVRAAALNASVTRRRDSTDQHFALVVYNARRVAN